MRCDWDTPNDFLQVLPSPIEFIRIDRNIAIVMGAETVQPIGDAPLAGKTVQRRFTNIWKKDAKACCAIRQTHLVPQRT